jgi:hypothetical protein
MNFYLKHLLIFGSFVLLFSCNNSKVDCNEYNYDCKTEEPFNGDLLIKLTINSENSKVPIWVYRGEYNDTSDLLYMDTVNKTEVHITLPLNVNYYAKVKYKSNTKIIYAVDGVFFKKYSKSVCDSTCWYIKNNVLDVRLKN